MARIYANSVCTVISPSPDPSKALFIERDVSLVSPAVLRLSPRDEGPSATVRLHPVLPNWTAEKAAMELEQFLQDRQPTRQRGWCMQEYELSCRTLILTTHQFGWICKQMQCSEEDFAAMSRPLSDSTISNGALLRPIEQLAWWLFGLFGRAERFESLSNRYHGPEHRRWEDFAFNRKLVQPPGLYNKWEKFVEEFTSRELTVPTDRLPAISGIAAKRQLETGDQYLAGLGKNNLKNELLWRVKDSGKSHRMLDPPNAPTWS